MEEEEEEEGGEDFRSKLTCARGCLGGGTGFTYSMYIV